MTDIPDRILEKYPMIESGTILTPENLDERDDFNYILYGLEYAKKYRLDPKLPITLLINGDGGDFDHAFALVDILQSLDTPTNGIIVGRATSAHVDLWLGCTYRDMLPHSYLGLHLVRMGNHSSNEYEYAEYMKELKACNQAFLELLTLESKAIFTTDYWQAELGKVKDGYIFVDRAKAIEYGLIVVDRPMSATDTAWTNYAFNGKLQAET